MAKHTQGELTIVPARYSRKTDILAFDICANITHNEITNICSILPKELCDNSYSGHMPNTNVSVEEAKANAERLVLCWNNFDAMYNALKEVVYPCGTIAVVPAGTKISIQFDVETIIKFQKLLASINKETV